MLRSGTSIGANANEAISAQSKKDFISKMSIANKEARETKYWIDLLTETGYLDGKDTHVKALDYLSSKFRRINPESRTPNPLIVNLGTGTGYSVLDVVHAFERASGKKVNYCIAPRRPGDIAACYANPSLAKQILGWKATRDIEQMCRDAWRWQEKNPEGFSNV